jgi:LPS export ABC transporter protein LptC
MSANYFFLSVGAVLLLILLLFRPMQTQTEVTQEVAQLELFDFVLHELDQQGLRNVLSGSEGKRFTDRYVIKDVNYTDNTKKYVENMRSDTGVYKGNVVTLEGNVRYHRKDGIYFNSEKATFDQNQSVARTHGKFVLTRVSDRVQGDDLYYNSDSGKIKAQNITAFYRINEKEKR